MPSTSLVLQRAGEQMRTNLGFQTIQLTEFLASIWVFKKNARLSIMFCSLHLPQLMFWKSHGNVTLKDIKRKLKLTNRKIKGTPQRQKLPPYVSRLLCAASAGLKVWDVSFTALYLRAGSDVSAGWRSACPPYHPPWSWWHLPSRRGVSSSGNPELNLCYPVAFI